VSCPTLAAPFTVNYSIAPATPATGDVFVGGGATGSVTCPAAAASLVAVPTTVQTLDDSLIGNARTYTMTISVPAVPGPAPAATVIGNAVATVVVADNDQPTSIPTMGAAGLGLLSLMLAGLAAFQRRRRA
ncbi:MAG TPA: IPTL-CTERM sorting domain-containing protein, partial [Casimicrobium huifangae]|nr:IPTL-CTERM sorting domain-containing protein [Casimicrobium huifangae]